MGTGRRPAGAQRWVNESRRGTDERGVCSIAGCERALADGVAIALCRYHIQKAWAAHIILEGWAEVPSEVPEEDGRMTDRSGVQGTIYFARCGETLKIGWTRDPENRFKELQADAIYHTRAGTYDEEARIHRLFKPYRTHGREWYEHSPEALALVERIRLGNLRP